MEFIEEFDQSVKLWTDGDDLIKTLLERDKEDVFEFAETMALISRYHFRSNEKPNENFSFVANSSLSGGRHPCANLDCRTKKIEQLTSFASLYADEVYIQNPFETVMLKGVEELGEAARDELIYGLINHYRLRPLIEKGIIKYAQNSVSLCKVHAESLAVPLSAAIEKKERQLFNHIHDYLIENCSISLDVGREGDTFLEISGPEQFIDHGKIYMHFYHPVPDNFSSYLAKNLPYKFSKEEIIDEEILSIVINPILRDLSNQEWHSAFFGTSYLCDNPVQMKIASKVNNTKYAASSAAFEKGMQHHLPAIYSKDIQTIVDLRERENEAFTVYRDKLNSMMKESKAWDEEEVSAIFRDQVLPQINLIDKKIKDWKSNARSSITEKIIFGAGAVTVGLYAGILPTTIGQLVAGLGGGAALRDILMEYNKTLKSKQEARSNDFYFLWQAKQ